MALRRYPDSSNAWLGGVCEGIGRTIGIGPWLLRMLLTLVLLYIAVPNILAAIVAIFSGFPAAVLAAVLVGYHWFVIVPYVLLWIFVPKEG